MKGLSMPSMPFSRFTAPASPLICEAPRHVENIVVPGPPEPARLCAICNKTKPAAQFAPARNHLTLGGKPCREKTCAACVRARFESTLAVGQRVFLRQVVEADARAGRDYAAPGASVIILEVWNCNLGEPPFYCSVAVKRTSHKDGIERNTRARMCLHASQLCPKKADANG